MDVEFFNPSIRVVSALPAFLCNRRFDLILQRLDLVGERRHLFDLCAIGEHAQGIACKLTSLCPIGCRRHQSGD